MPFPYQPPSQGREPFTLEYDSGKCQETVAKWEREGRFRQAFLPAFRSPFGVQGIGQSWITVKHPNRYLTDSMVAKHLQGDYYVGPSGRAYTKTATIDIDAHDEKSKGDVLERTGKVIDAITDASPLVFSTPRGGTHVTWWFPEAVWSARARAYVESQLKKSGMQVKSGCIEVFPHGKKILRVPLGRDCYLLDNDSLESPGDRRASIETLDWLLKHDKIDRLEIPESFNPSIVRARTGHTRNQREFNRPALSPYMRRVDRLLTFGLLEPSTRNDALMDLSWYHHVVLGHESETVAMDLRGWIEWAHNGVSQDYNRSPRDVYTHIDRIVANFDWSKVGFLHRPGEETSVAFGQALEFLRDITLNGRARQLLAHIIEYATKRGEQQSWGFEVRIPSRTLKSWDREYGRIIRLLKKKNHVQLGRGYSTRGYAQTYKVLTCPKLLKSA